MDESFDILYFDWLYAKIHLSDVPYNSYSELLNILYKTEFIWLLSGDDNRAEDGTDLRADFIRESKLDIDASWFNDGCSILELLVGFSKRAAFETELNSREWFWHFIQNLGLSGFYDGLFDASVVDDILYNFVWRTYEYDGTGGLFPLKFPLNDQRKVEIWYQFCAYLIDIDAA